MASRYTVIQYVPDPIADERINLGVLAYDERRVFGRFLTSWERVKTFKGSNVSGLKQLVRDISDSIGDDATIQPRQLSVASLETMLSDWQNVVRFTPPRFSTQDPISLLESVSPVVLTGIAPARATAALAARPRSEARRITVARIRSAVRSVLPPPEAREVFKRNAELPGKRGTYKYDAVVSNGVPYLAAHGLSLEAPIPQQVEDSVFWMLRDVRESKPDLPIGMVVLPPNDHSPEAGAAFEQYDRALRVFREFHAEVLSESSVEDWAESIVAHLPPRID